MKYSVIVPLYNRPDDIRRLLESLRREGYTDMEVIVVEDGSADDAAELVRNFDLQAPIKYHYKPNEGPGPTRNKGFEMAEGDIFIVLDSDAIVGEGYFQAIDAALEAHNYDFFGGPDKAHSGFDTFTKAMNYSMTSFLTTGGIRGSKTSVDTYHPRTFNMGLKRKVWETVGGFRFPGPGGEDLDFAALVHKAGFSVGYIPEAFVYHRRKATLKQFWRQVATFGRCRVDHSELHPGSLKATHLLPAFFLTYLFTCLFIPSAMALMGSPWLGLIWLTPLALFLAGTFGESLIQNGSLSVALTSVVTSVVQLAGYGYGFLRQAWRRHVEREPIRFIKQDYGQ
jgi:glycosyltransferase involved in cell wall biosynthesis